jgi:hypothetical protein
MRKINLDILVAVCIFTMVLTGPAGADTHYVSRRQSIRAAIDSASYGDTVEVSAGTYHEPITLKDGVAVIGAGARGDAG